MTRTPSTTDTTLSHAELTPRMHPARAWRSLFTLLVAASFAVGGVLGVTTPAAATAGEVPEEANTASGNPNMERFAGPDRYSAAAEVSQGFFPDGAPIAFVTTGEKFPDALAAGPAAHALGGPVLFVRQNVVPAFTANELERLAPQEIVVVGGPVSVSPAVVDELEAMAPGGVTRIGGADRYEGAANVAAAFFDAASVVYVATGELFPDGLTGGAGAATFDGLVLLVRANSIPAPAREQLERLLPETIVVVGGTDSISTAVEQELAAYANTVTRRGGADRYEAAANVARGAFPGGAEAVFVATGEVFPDALAAGGSGVRAPVLLVRSDALPPIIAAELERLDPATVFIVGGPASVSAGVAQQIENLLADDPPPAACSAGNLPPAGAPQLFSTVPGVTNQVALTFDMNGPTAPSIEMIQYLIDAQVCSTIFPDGNFSQSPDGQQVLAMVAANPHILELGNHTMNHCNLRDGTPGEPACPDGPATAGEVISELLAAEEVIEPQAGMAMAPFWRPPFGAYDQRVLNAAAEAGYTKTFMWDIDTRDWVHVSEGGPTADQMAAQVINNAQSGSIVLMHTGGYNTPEAVPMMVEGLRERGFTVTSLSDMLD